MLKHLKRNEKQILRKRNAYALCGDIHWDGFDIFSIQ